MINKEEIIQNWKFIEPLFGKKEPNFFKELKLDKTENELDVYLRAPSKLLKESQVNVLNSFIKNYNSIKLRLTELYTEILSDNEKIKGGNNIEGRIKIEIIDIPYKKDKFDFALISSIYLRRSILKSNYISLRIEFENGKVKTYRRTKR